MTNRSGLPCPIDFTTNELLQHQSEMELIEGILSIMHQLQDGGMVPCGGMVKSEFYEMAKELNNHFKEEFIGLLAWRRMSVKRCYVRKSVHTNNLL